MKNKSHKNKLFYGDCLSIMQDMRSQSVDLIYLDPPFNSNKAYNLIYKDATGRELPDQVEAFCDIWTLTPERMSVIRNMPVLLANAGIEDAAQQLWKLWMQALRHTQPRLLAYLLYMTERLVAMKRILRPTGSIYLHCDQTASHYIKSLMDAIFGHRNFTNEIIWAYRTGGASKKHFAKKHDAILFYKASNKSYFLLQKEKAYTKASGRKAGTINYGAGNTTFFEDEKGVYRWSNMRDVWEIPYINSQAKERLGYPTQKPIELMRRIILASSKKGDVVFDPFCGCATTIAAAHELERKWIGIDIAYHAIRRVVTQRLETNYRLKDGEDFTVDGVPSNVEGALDLWNKDKYQFQRWIVETINGFVTTKRTADGGIDGRIYFQISPKHQSLDSMAIEVKGGKNVGINTVRDLRGVLERDEAKMAGLIVRELSSTKRRNFLQEMSAAGMLETISAEYPRMQILTLVEVLNGKRFSTPHPIGKVGVNEALALEDMR